MLRRSTTVLLCALLALLTSATDLPAQPMDLLVSSARAPGEGQVLRFNGQTGASLGVFANVSESAEGIVYRPGGNVYVASEGVGIGAIDEFNPLTGALVRRFVNPFADPIAYTLPRNFTFGPDGNLYAGTTRFSGNSITGVLRYNGATGAQTGAFVPDGSGGLVGAFDVKFGPDGNLYVSEGGGADRSVRKYNGVSGAFLATIVPGGSGGLNGPTGLVFRPNGDLLVASVGSDSVLRYNGISGAFIDAFVAPGSGGLDGPMGMTFGPDGNLYVTSAFTDTVLRYNGVTGAFINSFVAPGAGGLNFPNFLAFVPAVPEPALAGAVAGLALLTTRRARPRAVRSR